MTRPSALLVTTTALSLLACAGVKLTHKPTVESFTASQDRLTANESIEFTAVVTDPDGVADILTGTLMDDSGVSYGAFEKNGTTWSLMMSFEAISEASPFEFTDEESRTFQAVFLDEAGHESKAAEVTVAFHCDGEASCDGACPDLDNDPDNCGVCGHVCEEYEFLDSTGVEDRPATCAEGHCVVAADCSDDLKDTCDKFCDAQGFSGCPDNLSGDVGLIFSSDPDRCAGDPIEYAHIETCDQDVSDLDYLSHMSCLCTE